MKERRLAYVRVVAELGLFRWAHPIQLSLLIPAVSQKLHLWIRECRWTVSSGSVLSPVS